MLDNYLYIYIVYIIFHYVLPFLVIGKKPWFHHPPAEAPRPFDHATGQPGQYEAYLPVMTHIAMEKRVFPLNMVISH